MNYIKLIRAGIASTLSTAFLFCASILPVIHADTPAVSYGFWIGEKFAAPIQKPLWTASVDVGVESAITNDGTVLSFSEEKLIALNLTTGASISGKATAYFMDITCRRWLRLLQ
ncbi:hypothetical protein [Paenibacillus sp.]|uniref:hypothetical protein n=1 Tax=Paenibacillus sp. TaxID=58172 RepID=UPI00282EFB75|nr:hypothetical protein [Paenibacillus sp.]MDR0269037.1 hypothetical protein [Paenibacillus sp.]